ncbi:uncharacterized protein LOC136029813 isoform X2 [Artemia franciscana]|uniref:uncharacterized protein LOC136029813 isoform X2 n=1 Tax=Artemia franciscana TaxID=6661 RepID=UPI0032DA94F8
MKIHRDPAILKTLASFADISNGDSRAKIRRFKQEVKIPSTILILVGLLMLNVVCPIRVEKGKMVWPKLNPPTFRGLWLEPNKYLYPDCGITKLKTIGNGRKDKVDVNSMEGMLELHKFPEVEEASLPWIGYCYEAKNEHQRRDIPDNNIDSEVVENVDQKPSPMSTAVTYLKGVSLGLYEATTAVTPIAMQCMSSEERPKY